MTTGSPNSRAAGDLLASPAAIEPLDGVQLLDLLQRLVGGRAGGVYRLSTVTEPAAAIAYKAAMRRRFTGCRVTNEAVTGL